MRAWIDSYSYMTACLVLLALAAAGGAVLRGRRWPALLSGLVLYFIVGATAVDSGALTFQPDANWNGSTNFSFSAHVGEAWSASPATFTVNVEATNDAPTADAGSVTVSEDSAATINLAGSDPDAELSETRLKLRTALGALLEI